MVRHDSTFMKYPKYIEWPRNHDPIPNGMRLGREYGFWAIRLTCSLIRLSVIPGTWGAKGGATEGGLGGTTFVRWGEGSTLLTSLRRIIVIPGREHTKKSTNPYRGAS